MIKCAKGCIAIVLLISLLLIMPAALAQDMGRHTEITVQGNGSVSAKPDIVTVRVNASAVAKGMLDAQQQISAIVDKATSALSERGIADEDIVTISYGYYPRYSYEEDTPKLIGYQANHELEIICRDVLLLDRVITVLTDSGISEIHDVSYGVADRSGLYRQALELAVRAAEEKAAAMAAASGRTLTGLLSMTENQSYDARYAMVSMAKGENALDTGIRSGSVSVSASVTAVYSAQ